MDNRFISGMYWFLIFNLIGFNLCKGCIEDDVYNLQKQMANGTQKMAIIENQLVTKSQEIAQIKKDTDQNTAVIAQLKEQQTENEKEIIQIKSQSSSNGNKIDQIKEKLANKSQDIQQIKNQLTNEVNEREKIQATQIKDGQTIVTIQSQATKIGKEIAQMKNEINRNKHDIVHLRGEVAKNGREISALKTKVTSVETLATKANDFLRYVLGSANGVSYVHTPPYTQYIKNCQWQVGVYNKYKGVGHHRGEGCLMRCIKESITDSTIFGAMHNLDPYCYCLQRGGKYIYHRRYRNCRFR